MTYLPRHTFYATPKKIKRKYSKIKPDFAYTVENWMKSLDPTTIMSESSMGARSAGFYYLAPQLNVYVEVIDKIKGAYVYSEDNHVCKIDIYTNNEDYVRGLIKSFNDQWDDGIVAHLNLKKLEQKFKVRGEDIVNAWNSWGISQPTQTEVVQQPLKLQATIYCSLCGNLNNIKNKYCVNCGNPIK